MSLIGSSAVYGIYNIFYLFTKKKNLYKSILLNADHACSQIHIVHGPSISSQSKPVLVGMAKTGPTGSNWSKHSMYWMQCIYVVYPSSDLEVTEWNNKAKKKMLLFFYINLHRNITKSWKYRFQIQENVFCQTQM